MTPLVEMRRIYKSFGAVQALRGVNLALGQQEVLGVVGDNAAGKSTLMKVLTGAYTPDQGEILLENRRVRFNSPHDSRAAGIEMVYQNFALAPNLSVSANIFLGRELRRGPGLLSLLDQRRMDQASQQILERLKIRVPSVRTQVKDLSGGQQQAVAIARAIAWGAKVVIMDEPTANLAAGAIDKVRQLISQLRQEGHSVILISHRIEDVFAVGDRILIMRRGTVAGEQRVADTTIDQVVRLIVAGGGEDEAEALSS